VRADEKGIRDLLSGLATMAATRFDPASATDRVAYSEMADKTRVAMNADNGGGVTSIQTTIALAQASIKSAKERHDGEKQVLSNLLDEAEGISNEEVATQLLALQTRLQASYQTTAMISKLSLVNYL
jgi:flagellar hook-associated protein 3 FlgL